MGAHFDGCGDGREPVQKQYKSRAQFCRKCAFGDDGDHLDRCNCDPRVEQDSAKPRLARRRGVEPKNCGGEDEGESENCRSRVPRRQVRGQRREIQNGLRADSHHQRQEPKTNQHYEQQAPTEKVQNHTQNRMICEYLEKRRDRAHRQYSQPLLPHHKPD